MRTSWCIVVVLIVATVALAGVVGKDGSTLPEQPPAVTSQPSGVTADFEWSSGGALNVVPTTGGSATGWAEYFIVMTTNTTAQPIRLDELGFPCGGPSASWGVWVQSAQPPNYTSPQYSGNFTPVDPNPATFPPTTYTYVDITATNVVVPAGADFWFGYLNPGIAGQVDFNGVITYGWYLGAWDPDNNYGRTTVMQVLGSFVVPVELQNLTGE